MEFFCDEAEDLFRSIKEIQLKLSDIIHSIVKAQQTMECEQHIHGTTDRDRNAAT